MLRAAGAAAARRWRLELFRTRRDGMLECVEYVVGDVCQYVVAGVVGLTKRHAKRHAKRVTRPPSSARCGVAAVAGVAAPEAQSLRD